MEFKCFFNMEFPLRTVVVVIYSISFLAVYGIDLGYPWPPMQNRLMVKNLLAVFLLVTYAYSVMLVAYTVNIL